MRLALDPAQSGITGRYYELDTEKELATVARDPLQAQALWAQAEQLAGSLAEPRIRSHTRAMARRAVS